MPPDDKITQVIREQIARIEATLRSGTKGHALGPKRPSMGQQENGE